MRDDHRAPVRRKNGRLILCVLLAGVVTVAAYSGAQTTTPGLEVLWQYDTAG